MRLRILALLALALAPALLAEAGDGQVRDFRLVQQTTPQLIVSNPAAMGFWSGRVAMVEANAVKSNGGLIALEESSDDFSIGALTESYYRISKLITFHGKLAWSHFSGKEMCGPVPVNPDFHPTGFYESDPEMVGIKKRELYDLTGGLSINLDSDWSLGFNVNYEAGDQTKVKDPRFSNILTNLDLKAGLAWHPSRNFMVGLSGQYESLLEQIRGGIYGATDKQYFIQNDRGAFFGTVEDLSGDYNIISSTNLVPLDNRFYGASLQVILFEIFTNEFTYRKRAGYYGKRSTTTPIYYEYGGLGVAYSGTLLLHSGSDIHRLAVDVNYDMVSADENRFNYVTQPGGNTIVEYTTKSRITDRGDMTASLNYRWFIDAYGNRPAATLGAKATYFARTQVTQIYPFFRNHSFSRIGGELFLEKDFDLGYCSIIPSLTGIYQMGWGVKKADGTYVETTSTRLKSFDYWLDRKYEYDTAARAGGCLSVTFAKSFEKFEIYLKISDTLTSLLAQPEFLAGRTRNIAQLTIGCNF